MRIIYLAHNVLHRKLYGLNLASATPFLQMDACILFLDPVAIEWRVEDELRAYKGGHRHIEKEGRTAAPTMPDGRAGRMAIVGLRAGMHGEPRSLG